MYAFNANMFPLRSITVAYPTFNSKPYFDNNPANQIVITSEWKELPKNPQQSLVYKYFR